MMCYYLNVQFQGQRVKTWLHKELPAKIYFDITLIFEMTFF